MKNVGKTALVTLFTIALFAVVSSNTFAGDKKSSSRYSGIAGGNSVAAYLFKNKSSGIFFFFTLTTVYFRFCPNKGITFTP